jgi:hypothetical protein
MSHRTIAAQQAEALLPSGSCKFVRAATPSDKTRTQSPVRLLVSKNVPVELVCWHTDDQLLRFVDASRRRRAFAGASIIL